MVPIYRKEEEKQAVYTAAEALASELRRRGMTVEVDTREEYKPGYKYFHWEQRGVPVRVEIGPRDIAARQVVIKRRDRSEKESVAMEGLPSTLEALMERMQRELLAAARKRLEDNTVLLDDYGEFCRLMEPVTAERGGGKFVMAGWCGNRACEDRLKETKATIRCTPLEDRWGGGSTCVVCGGASPQRVVLAKAY
jgi:prolyl-tRNA synthetase